MHLLKCTIEHAESNAVYYSHDYEAILSHKKMSFVVSHALHLKSTKLLMVPALCGNYSTKQCYLL